MDGLLVVAASNDLVQLLCSGALGELDYSIAFFYRYTKYYI